MQLMSDRFTIGSTPAVRALLAVGVSSPAFVLFLVAHGWAMHDPEIRRGLDLGVMWVLQCTVALALLINLITGLLLWPGRRLAEHRTPETVLICLGIGVVFSALSVAAGIFTSGVGLILLGVLAVGLLLFDLRPILLPYVVCVLGLLLHDLGVHAGWWTYAPALRPDAFIHGEPAWWFALWRQFISLAGFTVLIALLLLTFASLDRVIEQLSHLSNTDSLTGLANHRRFTEMLGTEVARQRRTGLPLCLVVIDADHFKQVNDAHGHLAGDRVLRTLGKLMMASVRSPIDLACRLGGEEFALILPDTTLDQALQVCERLRDQLATQHFQEGSSTFEVTVSMGVVQGQGQSVDTLLRLADEQLYRAKDTGRDRVCSGDPLPREGGR